MEGSSAHVRGQLEPRLHGRRVALYGEADPSKVARVGVAVGKTHQRMARPDDRAAGARRLEGVGAQRSGQVKDHHALQRAVRGQLQGGRPDQAIGRCQKSERRARHHLLQALRSESGSEPAHGLGADAAAPYLIGNGF